MSGGKCVVGTLIGIRKSAQSARLSVQVKPVAATGQQLVSVRLMPHVPDNAVIGGIENIM